jgi:hypothetical protein
MAQPHELVNDDRHLVNYLLGVLPVEELERLDEASIVDDGVAERLCDVENDLIDAYVTEMLDHDIRDQFEARYLKWPNQREKVTFARRFLTAVDRLPAPAAVAVSVASSPAVSPQISGSERIRRFSPKAADAGRPVARRSTVSWPFLTAAASLLLACGVLMNDRQLRQGLNQAERLGAAQGHRADTLTHELDQARNENVEIAQALERARAAASHDQPSVSGSLPPTGATVFGQLKASVLFPQTRSIGQVPRIDVASNANGATFDLRLESNEFPQYRALLKDSGTNRIIWRSAVLHARSDPPASISLVVPASVLESRHYSFELAGIDRAGHQTTTANYPVQIDRR